LKKREGNRKKQEENKNWNKSINIGISSLVGDCGALGSD
jgi:hypothetical protein